MALNILQICGDNYWRAQNKLRKDGRSETLQLRWMWQTVAVLQVQAYGAEKDPYGPTTLHRRSTML